jgi:hypothetical protein
MELSTASYNEVNLLPPMGLELVIMGILRRYSNHMAKLSNTEELWRLVETCSDCDCQYY